MMSLLRSFAKAEERSPVRHICGNHKKNTSAVKVVTGSPQQAASKPERSLRRICAQYQQLRPRPLRTLAAVLADCTSGRNTPKKSRKIFPNPRFNQLGIRFVCQRSYRQIRLRESRCGFNTGEDGNFKCRWNHFPAQASWKEQVAEGWKCGI